MLHLLFEFLAFQSDINFWKENKSLAGLSTRALITDLISQIVIFLFLVDSETSLLVTIPSFFGIIIQIWKVRKATGITFTMKSSWMMPSIEFTRWKAIDSSSVVTDSSSLGTDQKSLAENGQADPSDELARISLEADRSASYYLGSILAPVVLAYVAKSLIFDKHSSWYSWLISSLTSCV